MIKEKPAGNNNEAERRQDGKNDTVIKDKQTDRTGHSFLKYPLDKSMQESLEILGYKEPTLIQQMVIPAVLDGHDVVGKSQTGSGKTAAFAIPICQNIVWEENQPQALILEPTRELAVQVQEEIFQIGRRKRIKVPVVFGGMPIDKEVLTLKQKSHIVVGTPGRVLDHLKRNTLSLSGIKYLVIDEADFMLDMGFLEEVESIIQSVEKKPIMLLFSATLGEHLERLTRMYMQNPERLVTEASSEMAEGLEEIAYIVEKEDKFLVLCNLLTVENPEEAMIFCGTREMVNTLYEKLRRKRIRCGMLHGGMEQRERLYAIGDFRKGKFPYLITTDVAARGIDFPNITHVFHYDFPTNKENYVHRSGRSARNGKMGKTISLLDKEELPYKKMVETFTGNQIPVGELPSETEVERQRAAFQKKQKRKVQERKGKGAAFSATIMSLAIGGGKKSKLRAGDIVGAVCSIPGVSQEDIGVIDVRDSITYVEIQNGKGSQVLKGLQNKTIKGKLRKVRQSRKQM